MELDTLDGQGGYVHSGRGPLRTGSSWCPWGIMDSARVAGVAVRSGDADLTAEPGLPRTEWVGATAPASAGPNLSTGKGRREASPWLGRGLNPESLPLRQFMRVPRLRFGQVPTLLCQYGRLARLDQKRTKVAADIQEDTS